MLVGLSCGCRGRDAAWRALPRGSLTRLENLRGRTHVAPESGEVFAGSIGLRLPDPAWPTLSSRDLASTAQFSVPIGPENGAKTFSS